MSMRRFDIITIFPEPFLAYFNESILRRAREKKLIDIKIWNLRDFAEAPIKDGGRKQVDDRPFGGGPGMVMSVEPLVKALNAILYEVRPRKNLTRSDLRSLVILLDAGGK